MGGRASWAGKSEGIRRGIGRHQRRDVTRGVTGIGRGGLAAGDGKQARNNNESLNKYSALIMAGISR